ncbi:MAG: response regulator [Chloroflexi bacterium]|nr:response regulator [Chloroflexota bacterium]
MPEATAARPIEMSGSPAGGQKHSVLVVDDEELMIQLLQQILEDGGYQVVTASNGRQAIELLKSRRFDVVISDIMMPQVNGVEVLQQAIKQDPDCPVIMITGYPSVETAVKLINLGAADYIVKPFNVDLIKLTVAKTVAMCERGRGAEPARPESSSEDSETWNAAQIKRLLGTEVARSELRSHKLGVLVLEIDNLNSFSGENGAVSAGELVSKFAQTLEQALRPGDVSGKTGEGEWTLILPESAREEAQALGDQVSSNALMYASISGGLACYPWDASSASELLQKARNAKFIAKRKGGGQIVCGV